MPKFTQKILVDCQPKELFQFFTKPANIVEVSPTKPSLYFHSPDLLMGKGQIIHFDLSFGLFRIAWKSKITDFKPYLYFEDTLLEGPFKKWVHRHKFLAKGEKTEVEDEIDYELGYGWIGKAMDTLVVSYHIQHFFQERHKKTTEKFTAVRRETA